MQRRRRSLAVDVLLVVATVGVAMAARGRFYRGSSLEPASWTPAVSRERIVAEARQLRGIWYDPLQGYFGNLGGRLGLIVCMDVPVIAYRNAGASLRRLLEADYRAHPRHYAPGDGKPGDPYFHRRARNLYAYCKANGCLSAGEPPAPGDVAFFSRSRDGVIAHIALVSETAPAVRVVEASRDYGYVTREVPLDDVVRRGWFFRGYGSVLSDDHVANRMPPDASWHMKGRDA